MDKSRETSPASFQSARKAMSDIPVERILEANRNLKRYRFHLEMRPGLKLSAALDFGEGRQFARLGLTGKPFPLAEIYWQGSEGFAHLTRSDGWVRVQGEPFADDVQRLCELLAGELEPSVWEERDMWVLEYHLQHSPLRDQMRVFLEAVFGELPSTHLEKVIALASEYSRTLAGSQRLCVSRETHLIVSSDIEIWWEGGRRRARGEILPLEEPIPELPSEIREHSLAEVPLGMVVFYLDNIGGWSSKETHGPWTQRALDLIQGSESSKPALDRRYAELYDLGWSSKTYTEADGRAGVNPKLGLHHPLVVGAVNEDSTGSLKPDYDPWFAGDVHFQADASFYYPSSGYKRYYHHFGGDATGLEDKWYFVFHGSPATTKGNRFYSARDWGYGYGRINEALNRLTFTRAVEQYHRYNKQGKRLAYLMLGHVLHLLEDVGQPDHAALVDHAASSMDEIDAYTTFGYCHFLATEAALIAVGACGPFALFCGLGAFAIAEAACWASASSDVVGYEKLIGDDWNISRVDADIKNKGVVPRASYDSYFHGLAQFGMNKVSQLSLSYALGCGTLVLIPPIPNADPSIDSDDEDEVKPFFKLTDAIVPEIIGMSAGLLKHFYDIANYPPFLEQVKIVQFEPGARPVRFGVLKENSPKHCLRYHAEWKASGTMARSLVVHKNQPLALDYPAYAFLLFGPSDVYPERSKRMEGAELRLKGTLPGTGAPIDARVRLREAEDSKLGPYYWGTFKVSNCATDPYLLTLEVSGEDYGPHDAHRNPSGADLDTYPGTMPYADFNQPQFPWLDYTPGVDQHHKLLIPVPIWDISVTPPGPFALSTAVRRDVREKRLQIQQISWDCGWEPFDGMATCPTDWQLSPNVSWLSPSGLTKVAPWQSFHFTVELFPDPRTYMVIVRVTANRESIHGLYELQVTCRYGEFVDHVLLTFQIQ